VLLAARFNVHSAHRCLDRCRLFSRRAAAYPITRASSFLTLQPPRDVVAAQIAAIAAAGNIKCLLTYGSLGGAAFVPELAAAHGMKVIQGVWLDPDAANQEQINGGIALANANPDTVSAVMCGSEIRLRTKNHVVAEQLVASCVQQMRAAGVKQPLTHQATWPEWCNEEFPGQLFPNCEQVSN